MAGGWEAMDLGQEIICFCLLRVFLKNFEIFLLFFEIKIFIYIFISF
jgi:hypothetical protein